MRHSKVVWLDVVIPLEGAMLAAGVDSDCGLPCCCLWGTWRNLSTLDVSGVKAGTATAVFVSEFVSWGTESVDSAQLMYPRLVI